MAVGVNPQEQIMQRLQGIKDSRGPVGQMARGNNVYNSTSAAAQSGPGGADMGRPPMVPPAAQAALQARLGLPPQAQAANQAMPQQMNPNLQPQAPASPQGMTSGQSRAVGNMAQAALQAAAQRRMQRG